MKVDAKREENQTGGKADEVVRRVVLAKQEAPFALLRYIPASRSTFLRWRCYTARRRRHCARLSYAHVKAQAGRNGHAHRQPM